MPTDASDDVRARPAPRLVRPYDFLVRLRHFLVRSHQSILRSHYRSLRSHKQLAIPLALAALAAACGPLGPPRPVAPSAACHPFWMCAVAGDPRPRLPLTARTGKSLRLVLGPSVGDHFAVEDRDTMLRTEVHDLRRSLARGFENGFHAAFELVPPGAPADYVLEIAALDLSLQSVEIGPFQQVLSARADVRYRARLLDAAGREVRASSGVVTSRSFAPQNRDVTDGVMSAVAKLYEAIERDCFAPFERLP